MSAAQYMKKNWLNIALPWLLSTITVFALMAVGNHNINAKDIEHDREVIKEELAKKVDAEYVEYEITEAIADHEKLDAIRYKSILDMFVIIREEQKESRSEQREMQKDIKQILRDRG